MLNRYWNSPALALTVKRSRIRRYFLLALAFLQMLAVYQVHVAGFSLLALFMLLLSASCLKSLSVETLCGASVGWRQGQWMVFHAGKLSPMELRRGWVCLPWLVQFALESPDSGQVVSFSLFADSAEKADLQNLRRRLTLEG
ncbi:MAG: hypothetical protein V7754_08355 [Halioglobus sp.]